MSRIKLTPEDLREGAVYLHERNRLIQDEVTLLTNKINFLDANWEGAANCAFIDVFQTEVSPVLSRKLPEIIEGICGQLNGVANALEEADQLSAESMRN